MSFRNLALSGLFVLLGLSLPVQAAEVSFSDALVNRLRLNKPDQALVLECEKLLQLPSDEGDEGDEQSFNQAGFLNLLEANLDTTPETELLLLVGRREEVLKLAVLQRRAGRWVLAGQTPVDTWYYAPELGLMAGGGPERTFYVRQLEERGTGIYKEAYGFYKLLDGQLVNVLRVPIEARFYGWGSSLHQHLQVRVQALAGPEDRIRANYRYGFFAGSDLLDRASEGDENPAEQVFLAGDTSLDYVWDAASRRYLPEFYPEHALNQIKLESLETFGAPELFVRAFSTELAQQLKTATPEVKRSLKALMDAVPD